MITDKYCKEILEQYPEYITKDQMYRICHISKKTCLFLLESGLVPNIDSGKKTRRFKIKTTDVIQYLRDRDDYPELFKAPDGYYKGNGCKKAPAFDEVFTKNDLTRMRQFYEMLLEKQKYPDVMTVEKVAQFTGYNKNSVSKWCSKKQLQSFFIRQRYQIPKEYLLSETFTNTLSPLTAPLSQNGNDRARITTGSIWKACGGDGMCSSPIWSSIRSYPKRTKSSLLRLWRQRANGSESRRIRKPTLS